MAPPAPNSGKAYFALGKLSIEHPPLPPTGSEDVVLDQTAVDAWKGWWDEVKTGKRTYRFKGSLIGYGPDGQATQEQLEKIAKDRNRAAEGWNGRKGRSGVTDSSEDHRVSSNAPFIALISAGVAVLGSLLWHFRRTGKRG